MSRLRKFTTPLRGRGHHALPGRGLSLGVTTAMLGVLVVLPLAALGTRLGGEGYRVLLETLGEHRVRAALGLSLGAATIAALVNAAGGTLLAWVLTRYRFPGRRLLDAVVDLPFALPTAVAGIALTAVYAPNGWLGAPLAALGLKVAFAPAGVVLALVFVGLPFVVRTVQPVLAELPAEIEEAAASLGATRVQTLRHVVLPSLLPAVLTGFTLAFARGLGEYGSIVFISGNRPLHTEIAPLLIVTKLEQYDYAGAVALSVTMLVLSFTCLLGANRLQRWSSRRAGQALG